MAGLLGPLLREPVDAQRIDLLYRGTPVSAFVGFVEAFIISSLFWNAAPQLPIALWLAAFLAVRLGRVALAQAYQRAQPVAPADLPRWSRWLLVSAGVQSLAWGLGSFVLLAPDDLVAEWALHIGLAAVVHGSVGRLAHHGPAFLAYVAGVFVPLFVRDLWVGLPSHLLLAGLTLALGTYVLRSGVQQAHAIAEAARQRQRNDELIQALQRENEARQQAQQQAEAAYASKARFLAAISHDLRQPLNALALLAHTLHRHGQQADVPTLAARIVDCTDNMGSLVDDLLELSQLEAHAVEPRIETFALQPLLRELLGTHGPLATARGLQLGADPTDALVHTDRKLLGRVLANLVSNAIRYTDQGRVQLRVQDAADGVLLAVHDTGRGIDAAHLPYIFDEFYQAGNPQRDRRQGLGLGLATARHLSELLGLGIAVQSQPGEGSVFSLRLARGTALPAAPTPATAAPGTAMPAGRRVLVIEDDPDSRDALQGLLSAWGWQSRGTAGLPQALDALATGFQPDAVIADLRLSGAVSGVEAIEQIRAATHSKLPALIVTGDLTGELVRRAAAAGLPVLPKPIVPMRLRAFLNGRVLADDTAPG